MRSASSGTLDVQRDGEATWLTVAVGWRVGGEEHGVTDLEGSVKDFGRPVRASHFSDRTGSMRHHHLDFRAQTFS